MHRFSTYGLVVESSAAVPGVPLARAAGGPDVVVDLAEAGQISSAVRAAERAWYISPDRDAAGVPWLTVWRGHGFRFVYAEGAEFLIAADGTAVEGRWRAPLTVSDAASYLLGPVLAFVLRLRGVVPLHAAGVVIGPRALLFAGAAGAGKSSTVTALGALGYGVLSDDVVPLQVVANGVVAAPGFPRLSIWDDSASALLGASMPELKPWSDSYGKRCVDAYEQGLRFHDAVVEVGTIYVLQSRTGSGPGSHRLSPRAPGSQRLSSREALLALAANTYGSYLLDQRMRQIEFDVLTQVARAVHVRTLRFDEDLSRLAGACAALAADAGGD